MMISDQGREFVNKVNEELMALAGMEGTMLHVIRTLSSPPPPTLLSFLSAIHNKSS